jgi:hypothetical protein
VKVVRDVPGLCLYLHWFATNCFPVHSCDARAEDGVGVSDVNWFDGIIFNSVASHHSLELSVGGVAGPGLSFASKDGIFNLALGEPFIALAYGLYIVTVGVECRLR